MEGYIFVLKNPCFSKDLYYINATTSSVEDEIKALSDEAVPEDFKLVLKHPVSDITNASNHVHNLLKGYRLSNGKNFFRCNITLILISLISLSSVQ